MSNRLAHGDRKETRRDAPFRKEKVQVLEKSLRTSSRRLADVRFRFRDFKSAD
jgi:hypothetical protein